MTRQQYIITIQENPLYTDSDITRWSEKNTNWSSFIMSHTYIMCDGKNGFFAVLF